ncbi:MAG: hypothetical protein PUD22_09165 [Erysipelotrichaceae bacterium]|nr:hypothetical protein [Erysipelotrichaceae bacterium]
MTNEELISWINEMPEWVRKATMIFYQKGELSETDINELANLCLEKDSGFRVSGVNLINHGNTQGYSISSIDSIEGVNAISSDKPLKFNERGITVIYGLNGAGKSGYIRVFKMVSGAKYREEIKSNIYSNKKPAPKATISIVKDDGSKEQFVCDLRNAAEHDILRTMDIFDTKISNAYVNEAKEATYEPWIFFLFSELARIAIRIREELESRKRHYSLVEYNFQEKYKSTKAYTTVSNITYKSDLRSFPTEWTEEQESQLQELKKRNQIDLVKARLKQLEQQEKNLEFMIQYFVDIKSYFGNENWEQICKLQTEWKKSQEVKKASELVFSENANSLDASSVQIDSWKKLWQYAHKYSEDILEKNGAKQFAHIGSKCPLCGQIIQDEYVSHRMESIDSYVNGKATDEEKKAYRVYEEKVKNMPILKSPEDFLLLLEACGCTEDIPAIVQIHNNIITYAKSINDDLKNSSLCRFDVTEYLTIFKSQIEALREELANAKELLENQAQKNLEQQILEAEAEQYLVSLYQTICRNIDSLVKINELEKAIKLTSTNKITSKSKKLAEEMITADYVRRFESELQNLTGNSIAVKLSQQKAGKGKIPYKVVLFDVNGNQTAPQDILSEGENRVTSLAAFFAEASGRSEITPLIVDDPISSLDYNYETKVIDRLVNAARERQVIVFTHRISMVVGISDRAKVEGIAYDEVTLLSSRNRKGVPSDNSSIGGKVKKQLNILINGKLKKLKSLDELEDEYTVLFHNVCQEFRNIVEKSVEDVLLAEVVKRFRKDIQTKNRLDKLSKITDEDLKLIDRLMTKYSYYDHSMSDETPLIEMSVGELERDLLELKDWITKKN